MWNFHRNVQRFRGGLVFKAHRLLYHSTLGLRVVKKVWGLPGEDLPCGGCLEGAGFTSEKEFFIDNLLVRFHFIIVMIRWTGLAPWEFEWGLPGEDFPCGGCLKIREWHEPGFVPRQHVKLGKVCEAVNLGIVCEQDVPCGGSLQIREWHEPGLGFAGAPWV